MQGQQAQELRMVNEIRQDVENRLAALNLTPDRRIMAPKFAQPGSRFDTHHLTVTTNMYALQAKTDVIVFRYQVSIEGLFPKIEGQERRPFNFNARVNGDSNYVIRTKERMKIFRRMGSENRNDFPPPLYKYFYDSNSILYTIDKLPIENSKVYHITTDQDFLPNFQAIRVTIQKVHEHFNLNLRDVRSQISRNLDELDRSLQQFFEIALNQSIYFNDEYNCFVKDHVPITRRTAYFMDPTKFGFTDRDTPSIGEDRYLSIGVQKSVRFIEGENRTNTVASAVVEVKKTPFHLDDQLLIKKVKCMVHLGRDGIFEDPRDVAVLNKGLKGLFVEQIHRPDRRFVEIVGVVADSARRTVIPERNYQTIEQYFLQVYAKKLDYPLAPLVEIRATRQRDRFLRYPIEVLKVAANQRVLTEQQTPDQIAKQIQGCAVLPSTKKVQINNCVGAIKLYTNQHLRAANVGVSQRPLQIDARVLGQPGINYQRIQRISPDADGTWTSSLKFKPYYFLIPAKCNKWEVWQIAINEQAANRFESTVNEFTKLFVGEALKRGMDLNKPKIGKIPASEDNLKWVLDNAVKNGVQFVFFVHADQDTQLHGLMKYFELEGIITQDLKASTADKVVGKKHFQTLENIVMKTNIKLGGLNHFLVIQKDDTNSSLNRMLDRETLYIGFGTNHPGGRGPIQREENAPPTVMGIIAYEIPLIKKALRDREIQAELVLIVLNRLHHLRFMPRDINEKHKAPEQNVKPGMVIDTQIVHPLWNEFYLCSHTTLQGTANVSRYTILYNDSKLTANQIQEATMALAYGYQIVRSPTSLPAPAYIAGKYANRGRTIYLAHCHRNRIVVPDQLNEQITYANKDLLRGKRINA